MGIMVYSLSWVVQDFYHQQGFLKHLDFRRDAWARTVQDPLAYIVRGLNFRV